jgi:hypothetical protein
MASELLPKVDLYRLSEPARDAFASVADAEGPSHTDASLLGSGTIAKADMPST